MEILNKLKILMNLLNNNMKILIKNQNCIQLISLKFPIKPIKKKEKYYRYQNNKLDKGNRSYNNNKKNNSNSKIIITNKIIVIYIMGTSNKWICYNINQKMIYILIN